MEFFYVRSFGANLFIAGEQKFSFLRRRETEIDETILILLILLLRMLRNNSIFDEERERKNNPEVISYRRGRRRTTWTTSVTERQRSISPGKKDIRALMAIISARKRPQSNRNAHSIDPKKEKPEPFGSFFFSDNPIETIEYFFFSRDEKRDFFVVRNRGYLKYGAAFLRAGGFNADIGQKGKSFLPAAVKNIPKPITLAFYDVMRIQWTPLNKPRIISPTA